MDQQSLLANALASIANAAFITDCKGRIVWANNAFRELSGYSAKDMEASSPALLKSGLQPPDFYRDLWQAILGGQVWQGEVVERKKDGTLYTVEETITPLSAKGGEITHFVVIQHVIASRRKDRERDHFLAYHDSLTGLPNRAHFLDLLDQSIAYAGQESRSLALLFVDLDRFKPVNDTFGHHTGDLLLQAVADRLRGAVRKTDIVARIGGDEFTIIESGIDGTRPVHTLARNLVEAIGRPYMIDGHKIVIGASIGIAMYPGDGDSPGALLDRADAAMYRAKSRGKDHYEMWTRFEPAPQADSQGHE